MKQCLTFGYMAIIFFLKSTEILPGCLPNIAKTWPWKIAQEWFFLWHLSDGSISKLIFFTTSLCSSVVWKPNTCGDCRGCSNVTACVQELHCKCEKLIKNEACVSRNAHFFCLHWHFYYNKKPLLKYLICWKFNYKYSFLELLFEEKLKTRYGGETIILFMCESFDSLHK